MISIKPPNCTEAARAVYHRRHMPINLTTSSSSHRQQLNKETELLAAVTPVTPSWHETFCLSSTVGQTSHLPDSDGFAPNTATLCCHVSATPVTQGEWGRTSPKWDSLRSVVSLQIQTESFPRLEAESYFYKSENPLGKLGSSSEDISCHSWAEQQRIKDYVHCIEKKHRYTFYILSFMVCSQCWHSHRQTVPQLVVAMWSFFLLIHYKICVSWTCIQGVEDRQR